MKILVYGRAGLGYDDDAIIWSFIAAGHHVEIVDDERIVLYQTSKIGRYFRRLIRRTQINHLNSVLSKKIQNEKWDVFFAFKGAFLQKQTLELIKRSCKFTCLFYPDPSLYSGIYDLATIPLYDLIVSNKPNLSDQAFQLGYHGEVKYREIWYDSRIAKLSIDKNAIQEFDFDLSFVGNWSQRKFEFLSSIAEKSGLTINVFGYGWENNKHLLLRCNPPSFGLGAARIYKRSKINLCILSDSPDKNGSKDSFTTRSVVIPAYGGFLIHENTPAAQEYLNQSSILFDDADHAVRLIRHFLLNEGERIDLANKIAKNLKSKGFSSDDCAKQLSDYFLLKNCT